MTTFGKAASAAVMMVFFASTAHAANLLTNGSFEQPKVPKATNFIIFPQGSTIPGWTVVGPSPGSNGPFVLGKKYSERGGTLHFPSKAGAQSIDLTGPFNVGPVGLAQTVATNAGGAYKLTFWLGNQDDSKSDYTLASSAEVFVNGVSQGTFSTDNNTPDTVTWQKFVVEFVATTNSTTITLINRTNVADNMCGLDAVTLIPIKKIH